jgi:predicted negative regulator of RcsB-dependent stress response
MQPPDAPTAFLFKLWPWIEANKYRAIAGTVIVLVAIFLYSFFSWHSQQKEIAAGRAITQLLMTPAAGAGAGQWADGFLKIAREYPGTPAGERAWLEGAMALFTAGRFPDAQAQFQKMLDTHPDGDLSASAALGVAASLEALGKLDAAASAYQQVINGFSSDLVAATTAKFALARIDGQQGKISDALNLYDSIARTSPGGQLGQEAMLRAMELRTKSTSATTAPGQP